MNVSAIERTGTTTATQPARPDVVLIMADQLVPMLTGPYGHPVVQTPNLDALAARGTRFDAAYSPSPLCAPARACLMTGTYVSTNRVYDNAAFFASDIPTLPHYLTNAGYDCVLSGKMHFVGPDQLHGFRARFTPDIAHEELVTYGGRPPWTFSRDPASFRVEDGRGHAGRAYAASEIHVGRWHFHLAYDDEVQLRAIEYVRARSAARKHGDPADATARQPFCLVASYHHPHDPFWPPQDLWDLYEGAEIALPGRPDEWEATYSIMDRWLNANHGTHQLPDLRDPASLRRLRRAYYALVTYVDRKVGELIAALKEHGLWDNAVVVFTSDHGDMLGEKGMIQKRSFYEYSARVPLIVRLPGDAYAGTVVREPVSLVDLLPTLCRLAGIPAESLEPHDGRDLLPLIDGSDTSPRTVFSEEHVEEVATTCFMVRRGTWKYVHIHGLESQLFDLEADPGEWHSLAGRSESKAIEDELRAALLTRFDPDAVERDVRRSLGARRVIRDATARTGRQWGYCSPLDPNRDALQQYLKGVE
jgi:choline-sulfatase